MDTTGQYSAFHHDLTASMADAAVARMIEGGRIPLVLNSQDRKQFAVSLQRANGLAGQATHDASDQGHLDRALARR